VIPASFVDDGAVAKCEATRIVQQAEYIAVSLDQSVSYKLVQCFRNECQDMTHVDDRLRSLKIVDDVGRFSKPAQSLYPAKKKEPAMRVFSGVRTACCVPGACILVHS
jgi:hypothetical protein